MKKHEILDIIEDLDPAYIEAAATVPTAKKPARLKKWIVIAACFTLLLCSAFGICAGAVEAKEYNAAIKFFNDYDLSTEGLSRGEIKKIYRDITTRSFSYAKTAEVIQSSLSTDKIGGYEILQDDPTPEDVENLWNYKKYNGRFFTESQDGIHYEFRVEHTENVDPIRFIQSHFEKYDGDKLVWSVPITDFEISGYSIVSDGVIAYGEKGWYSGLHTTYAWMAKLDEKGNILWKRMVYHNHGDEYIASILKNADGSYAVISRADLKYFCLSQYTSDGQEVNFKITNIGNYGIWNAARFGDGYIVQLGNHMTGEYARIVKVDHEGNIIEDFSYSSEDSYYYITDMIEYYGKIYLSAYAVPKLDDETQNAGGRHEIAHILNYLFDNGIWEISGEELTPMVRDNYTAMLLVCDPDGGTPQEFYSVKGSLGGQLSLNNSGQLLWETESITTTFFSPATNAYTIGGTCYVFQYTFDYSGALISQEKTDKITGYHR